MLRIRPGLRFNFPWKMTRVLSLITTHLHLICSPLSLPERPPQEPVAAIELPSDVAGFIADYHQALFNLDRERLTSLFSDRFLLDGFGKRQYLVLLSSALPYISKARLIPTKFEAVGNIATIEGVVNDKYFEMLASLTKLIKENGHWKWYGNQKSK